jgi:glycosyltransferase 2 family protein
MSKIAGNLRRFFSNFWSNRSKIASSNRWRVIGTVLVLLSLGLMVRTLGLNFAQFKAVQVELNWIYLSLGLLFAWIAGWMGVFAWREIVRVVNPEVPGEDAIHYHLISLAVKYLPGFGWQQVSKVFQLYRGGVLAGQTWQPVLLELLLIIAAGSVIAATFFVSLGHTFFGWLNAPELKILAVVFLWVCYLIMPVFILRLIRSRKPEKSNAREILFHLWVVELLDIGGCLILGLSLWFLIHGITQISADVIPYCIIASILSVLGGLAVIFVPNGIGVREAILFTMLQGIISMPLSLIAALLFRIVSVIADIFVFSPFLLKKMLQKQVK